MSAPIQNSRFAKDIGCSKLGERDRCPVQNAGTTLEQLITICAAVNR